MYIRKDVCGFMFSCVFVSDLYKLYYGSSSSVITSSSAHFIFISSEKESVLIQIFNLNSMNHCCTV